MPFIGDQAWFYLSARDSMQSHTIPLVGITSSHTWLHQGPLWTYLLMIVFSITKYNPVAPGYFTAFFGVLTTYLMYITGKNIFSKRVGLIAASLFAFSPLAIFYSRMPYHTSLIPFFTTLFILVFYKWILGNIKYLPVVFLLLGILYNFELATVLFVYLFLIYFIFGKLRHANWVTSIKLKDFSISLILLIISLMPVIFYDIQNGFPQTLKFAAWNAVQLAGILGIHLKKFEVPPESMQDVVSFFFFQYRRLIFLPSLFVSVLLFIFSIIGTGYVLIHGIKNKMNNRNHFFIFFSSLVLLLGFFAARTRSEAYLPMIFPFVIFLLAITFDLMMGYRKIKLAITLFIFLMLTSNALFLIHKNYFAFKAENQEGFIYGPGIKRLTEQSNLIVLDANKKSFNLIGGGFLHDGSGMDNFEYLVWYLGGNISALSKTSYVVYPEHLAAKEKNIIYYDEYIKIVRKTSGK